MQKIALLSDFVIDQIAAGEVLEHPAAAVKELIENSIDAGSLEISIAIEGGGLQRILIEDDGCGMSRSDALLCMRRHATSKIRSQEDLERLITMGFRGEALAALSAVSKLDLKTFDGSESTQIAAVGGEFSNPSVCARNRGTSIEARSLFFNAPARLKFQKSPSACSAAILKVVQTISLAHPEILFRLQSNGKLTFHAEQKGWKERAEQVLGSFAHDVNRDLSPYSIRGLLGRPDEGKGNRSGQTLFVNRRPIFSPLIAKAVKEGFGTRICDSLFPVFLLFLQLPADCIDVNVHPQKKEIRFREEAKVYCFVRDAVAQSFGGAVEIAPAPWDFSPSSSPSFSFEPLAFNPSPFVLRDAPLQLPVETATPKGLLGRYLLVEAESWILIDLQGAQARILFEEMQAPHPAIQPLLWPLEIRLGPQESEEEMVELLKKACIEARAVGKRTVAVDAIPAGLEPANVEAFIREFVHRAQDDFVNLDSARQRKIGLNEEHPSREGKGDSEERFSKVAASPNSPSLTKRDVAGGGQRRLAAALTKTCRCSSCKYSFEEAVLIWRRLKNCRDSEYDPLGKKIKVRITEEQIGEFFD